MAGAGVGLSMAGSEPTSLVGNRADLFGWSQSRPLWLEPEPTSLVGAGADLFGWSRSRSLLAGTGGDILMQLRLFVCDKKNHVQLKKTFQII